MLADPLLLSVLYLATKAETPFAMPAGIGTGLKEAERSVELKDFQ